jgi:hypothetical protein
MEQKQELVQRVSVAAAQVFKMTHQSLIQAVDKEENSVHAKMISRTLTGQLSPAIYQLLSDGLLPIVNTLFGQVTNSVWRVVEASVKKGPMLPWIEELVFCLNNEESLPEGPVRFGVFITELINMGGLDWWLENLSTKEMILRRHYAPNGFLYLCNTTTRSLMEELLNCLTPLASLPFDNSLSWKHDSIQHHKMAMMPPAAASPVTPTPILKSPTRTPAVRTQRPLSYAANSSKPQSPRPLYRRTQSQHSGLSPSKSPQSPKRQQSQQQQQQDNKVEEFSWLKQKWESMCKKKAEPGATTPGTGPTTPTAANNSTSPLKSRIPRPVFRVNNK